MATNFYDVGGACEAWCGRCKLMLRHTVETMAGSAPARVQCRTCKSQHQFKNYKPGENVTTSSAPRQQAPRAAKPKASVAGAVRGNDYDRMIGAAADKPNRPYSPATRFAVGDVLVHKTFGIGIVLSAKDSTKIDVLFREGARVLIHAK